MRIKMFKDFKGSVLESSWFKLIFFKCLDQCSTFRLAIPQNLEVEAEFIIMRPKATEEQSQNSIQCVEDCLFYFFLPQELI